MENMLYPRMNRAFEEDAFLRKLRMTRSDAARLFGAADWNRLLSPLLPVEARLSCAQVLAVFHPLLDMLAPEPAEGWLAYTYQVASSLLYPQDDRAHTAPQWDGALCFLQFLRELFDLERETLPFDPWLDFAFCTEEELADSGVAEEYRQFLRRFREEYVYELLRLGREVTPFRTLEHIAGVHHVSMSVARAFKAGGGLIDLGLMSGAAAGHDIDDTTADHLLFTCGSLMTELVPESGKIAAYAKGRAVTVEDINAVADPVLDARVFDMTNSITAGKYDQAAQVLGELLRMQTEPIVILAAVGKELRRLYTARMALDAGKDRFWLKQLWSMSSDYPAKLLMQAAGKVDHEWCQTAVIRCQRLDRRMKSEKNMDSEAELKLFLMELAGSR